MQDNNKKYSFTLPDGRSGVWTEEQMSQGRDALYKKYPDAQVVALSDHDAAQEIDNDAQYVIDTGDGRTSTWNADQMRQGYDALMTKYPKAKVVKAKQDNYWQEKAVEQTSAIRQFDADNEEFFRQHEKDTTLYNTGEASRIGFDENAYLERDKQYKDLKAQRQQMEAERANNPYIKSVYEAESNASDQAITGYDEQMKELRNQNLNIDSKSMQSVKPLTTENGIETTDAQEYKLLKQAKKLAGDTKKLYNIEIASDDNGFADYMRNMGKGAADTFSNEDFWSRGLTQMARDLNVLDIEKRLSKGGKSLFDLSAEEIDKVLTPSEKALFKEFIRNGAAQAERAGNMARGYTAGQTAAESVGFMAEFLVTGAVAKGLGTALEASESGFGKWIARELTGKTAEAIGSKVGQVAYKAIAQPIEKAIFHTALHPTTYSSITKALTEIDDHGYLVDAGQAIGETLLDQVIENWSESVGEPLENILPTSLIARGATSATGQRILSKIGVADWAKMLIDSDAHRLLMDAGFNGLVGELAEEWAGNAVRVATGLMSKDEFAKFAAFDEQVDMLASFAPMSLFGLGTQSVAAHRVAKERNENLAIMRDVLARQGWTDNAISNVFDNAHTKDEIKDLLRPVVDNIVSGRTNGGEATTDYMAVLDFARINAMEDVLSQARDYEQEQARNDMRRSIENDLGATEADPERGRFTHTVQTDEGQQEAVTTVTDENGDIWYYIGENGANVILRKKGDAEGQPLFVTTQDYQDRVNDGTYREVTNTVDDYLTSEVEAQRKARESRRINDAVTSQYEAMNRRMQENPVIHLGTEASPKDGMIIGVARDGVLVQFDQPTDLGSGAKVVHRISLDEAINATGALQDADTRTDEQIAADEADRAYVRDRQLKAYNQKYKDSQVRVDGEPFVIERFSDVPYNTEDGTEVVKVAARNAVGEIKELVVPVADIEVQQEESQDDPAADPSITADTNLDFRGNPLPMKTKEDGTQVVDVTALWNSDPEAYLRWNDQQRHGNTNNSMNFLSANINSLQQKRAAIEKQQAENLDPASWQALEDSKTAIDNKINTYNTLLAAYQQEKQQADALSSVQQQYAQLSERLLNAKTAEQTAEIQQKMSDLRAEYNNIYSQGVQAERLAQRAVQIMEWTKEYADMPVKVLNLGNAIEVLTADKCDPAQIQDVESKINWIFEQQLLGKRYVMNGVHLNGTVYLFAEGCYNEERTNATFFHERQHEINERAPQVLDPVLQAFNGDVQAMEAAVQALSGSDSYAGSKAPVLADELLAFSIERAYSGKNMAEELHKLGLPAEFINFVTDLYEQQTADGYRLPQNGNRSANGARHSITDSGLDGSAQEGASGDERLRADADGRAAASAARPVKIPGDIRVMELDLRALDEKINNFGPVDRDNYQEYLSLQAERVQLFNSAIQMIATEESLCVSRSDTNLIDKLVSFGLTDDAAQRVKDRLWNSEGTAGLTLFDDATIDGRPRVIVLVDPHQSLREGCKTYCHERRHFLDKANPDLVMGLVRKARFNHTALFDILEALGAPRKHYENAYLRYLEGEGATAYTFETIIKELADEVLAFADESIAAGENLTAKRIMAEKLDNVHKDIIEYVENEIGNFYGKDEQNKLQPGRNDNDMLSDSGRTGDGGQNLRGGRTGEMGGSQDRSQGRSPQANEAERVISEVADVFDGKSSVAFNGAGELVAVRNEGEAPKFSVRTWDESGRDALVSYLNSQVEAGAVGREDADNLLAEMDRLTGMAKDIAAGEQSALFSQWSYEMVRTKDGTSVPVLHALKKNSEYELNIDFSTVCKKRQVIDHLFNRVIHDGFLQHENLSPADIARMNQIIQKHGLEIACGICFVDSKRYNAYTFADGFLSKFNPLVASLMPGMEVAGFNYSNDEAFSNEGKPDLTQVPEVVDWSAVFTPEGNNPAALDEYQLNWKGVYQVLKPMYEKARANMKKAGFEEKFAKNWKKQNEDAIRTAIVEEAKAEGRKLSKKAVTAEQIAERMPEPTQQDRFDYAVAAVFANKTSEQRMALEISQNPAVRKLAKAEDFIASEGWTNILQSNEALETLWNVQKGAAGARPNEGNTQYKSEVLEKGVNGDIFDIAGYRMQSFSDFIGRMYFDYMQAFADLSAMGLPGHAYTKEPSFVKLFGLMGMKVNMSLVSDVDTRVINELGRDYAGLTYDANGNLTYNFYVTIRDAEGNILRQGQTFPPEEAYALQDSDLYSKNVGTIAVGLSRQHILMMLRDPRIRMVIPYHKSGLPHGTALVYNLNEINDYTNTQNTRGKDGASLSKEEKAVMKKRVDNFNFILHQLSIAEDKNAAYNAMRLLFVEGDASKVDMHERFNELYNAIVNGGITTGLSGRQLSDRFDSQDFIPKVAADIYLEACEAWGYEPKFMEFSNEQAYYKVLIDFAVYDKNGTYTPQETIKFQVPENVADLISETLAEDEAIAESERQQTEPIIREWEHYLSDKALRKEQDRIADKEDSKITDEEREFMRRDIFNVGDPRNIEQAPRAAMSVTAEENEDLADESGDVRFSIEELGTPYYQFKGDAKGAVEFLKEKKEGQAIAALYHDSVGYIDLPWGREGTGKSDGFGLAKLVKFHPEVVDNLQGILDSMTEVSRSENRVNLEDSRYKAGIRLTWNNESKTWLLTLFEKKNSVSDNTTDTVGTSLDRSKRNDTATPQNTVSSADKDTNSSENSNTPKADFSVTAEQDAEYLAAVEAGDMEKAQRMVDEAANAAGYNYKAYHGSWDGFRDDDWNETPNVLSSKRKFFLATDKKVADSHAAYGKESKPFYVRLDNPMVIDAKGADYAYISDPEGEYSDVEVSTDYLAARYRARHQYDGLVIENVDEVGGLTTDIIPYMRSVDQVRSADPVTRDDNGNIIPLSERFNPESNDLRFSVTEEAAPASDNENELRESMASFSIVRDEAEIERLNNEPYETAYHAMQIITMPDGKRYLFPPMAAIQGDSYVEGIPVNDDGTITPTWEKADEHPELAFMYTKGGKGVKVSADAELTDGTITVGRGKNKKSVPWKFYEGKPLAGEVNENGEFEPSWYFELKKGNKGDGGKKLTDLGKVAYDPYQHSGENAVNDQFTTAYDRSHLVIVKVRIPKSEMTGESGYKADKAKLGVGTHEWNGGKLKTNKRRMVTLSRWDMPEKILTDAEVAADWKKVLDENGLTEVPFNIVTPGQREALETIGVTIGEPTKDNAGVASRPAYEEWKNSPRFSVTERGQQLFDAAVEEFGTTTDFREAGYLLPDGRMLDFSEKNNGGEPGRRGADHRDIGRVINDRNYDTMTEYMDDFINEGAIRLIPESGAVSIAQQPSKEQKNRLRDFIYRYNGEVEVEIYKDGHSVADAYYRLKTAPSRVLGDIDKYFNDGIIPEGNEPMFSITPEQDEEFRQAYEAGDAEKAAQMVKDAFKSAYPNTKVVDENGDPKVVYHAGSFGVNGNYTPRTEMHFGTKEAALDRFRSKVNDWFWYVDGAILREDGKYGWEIPNFADFFEEGDPELALYDKLYNEQPGYNTPAEAQEAGENALGEINPRYKSVMEGLRKGEINQAAAEQMKMALTPAYLNIENPLRVEDMGDDWSKAPIYWDTDGYVYKNEYEDAGSDSYVVFKANQVKSADPFTFDDNGELIPLSQRFDSKNNDIRWSVTALPFQQTAKANAVANMFRTWALDEVDADVREYVENSKAILPEFAHGFDATPAEVYDYLNSLPVEEYNDVTNIKAYRDFPSYQEFHSASREEMIDECEDLSFAIIDRITGRRLESPEWLMENMPELVDTVTFNGGSISADDVREQLGLPESAGVDTSNYTIDTDRLKGGDARYSIAYHGTGAEFDRFDSSHLGEGEGAIAHGWGMYVAFDKSVGEGYAKRIGNAGLKYDGVYPIDSSLEANVINEIIRRVGENTAESNIDAVIADLMKEYEEQKAAGNDDADRALRLLGNLDAHWDFKVQHDAYLYNLEIPDDNGSNYLDEQKVYEGKEAEELKARVTEALTRRGVDVNAVAGVLNKSWNQEMADTDRFGGGYMYTLLTMEVNEGNMTPEKCGKEASMILKDAGFVGIKYDGKVDGDCAVIFDENDLKINDRVQFSVSAAAPIGNDELQSYIKANGLAEAGEEEVSDLMMHLFSASDEAVRETIAKDAPRFDYSFSRATAEYFSDLAEKDALEASDVVAVNKMRDVLREYVGLDELSAADALWMMYRTEHPESDDVFEIARTTEVAARLGHLPADNEGRKAADTAVRMSITQEMQGASAAEMYNSAVSYWRNRLKEGYVDMFESVNDLMEAMEIATGQKAESYEDVRVALNQQSSKALDRMKRYTSDFLEPLWEAIAGVVQEGGKMDEIIRYVELKHALERNEVFAKRDAIARYRKERDDQAAPLESERRKKVAEQKKAQKANNAALVAQLQQEIDDLDQQIDAIDQAFDKHKRMVENGTAAYYHEEREKDFAGLTSMYSDYPGLLPRDKYKTDEEYNKAARKVRKPMYDNVADMEQAAKDEVDTFESRIGQSSIDNLWEKINAATKETLRSQYASGIMSKAQYDAVSNMFEHYVPLRGFSDTVAEDVWSYYGSAPAGSFSAPVITAKGRTTEAENPFLWIGTMASSAIAQNMKNESKLALYYYAMNHTNQDLVAVQDMWYELDAAQTALQGRKVFVAAYPPLTAGMSPQDAAAAYAAWENTMKQKASMGDAYTRHGKFSTNDEVAFIDDKKKAEHYIRVKANGKDLMMYVNGSPRAAQAINGLLNLESNAGYQHILGPLLRLMSSVNTSWNPEFWISNMERDLLFAMMSMDVKGDGMKEFRQNLVNPARMMRLAKAYEEGTLGNLTGEDAKYAQYYEEFAAEGAITGYTVVTGNEMWEKEIDKWMRKNGVDYKGDGKDNLREVKNAVGKFFTKFNELGEAVEQMTRFAAFVTARKAGKSITDAVNDAKEITVNFNRKGSGKALDWSEMDQLTKADGTPLGTMEKAAVFGASLIPAYGRRLVMFFNAAVQGLNAMYKLWEKDKRKTTKWMAGYFAAGVLQAIIHAMLDDDDDYLNIPEYTRRANAMIGAGGVYFKWALPQESRFFYAAGDMLVQHMLGNEPNKNLALEVIDQALDLSPINPAGGITDVLPSVAQPLVENYINKDFTGANVYYDNKYLSDDERARTPKYTNTKRGTSGWAITTSQFLNWVSGGDKDDAGWWNWHPESIQNFVEGLGGGTLTTVGKFYDTAMAATGAGDFTVKRTPFLNRVIELESEHSRESHTNELWYYYKGEAEHTKTKLKKLEKEGDTSGYLDLKDSQDYGIYQLFEEYQKKIKPLEEDLKIEEDPDEKRRIIREQDELKREMIREISNL